MSIRNELRNLNKEKAALIAESVSIEPEAYAKRLFQLDQRIKTAEAAYVRKKHLYIAAWALIALIAIIVLVLSGRSSVIGSLIAGNFAYGAGR